jgi:hypothetical protein
MEFSAPAIVPIATTINQRYADNTSYEHCPRGHEAT